MAQKLFYTYKHGSNGTANNSFVPSTYIFSYWDSLVFDVNHRTIWHQGMPFGNVYPGTASYGEIFNDLERNTAKGAYSHAEGEDTHSYGSYSHVEGFQTKSDGVSSHAEGEGTYTYATAQASHVEGHCSYASGNYGHAEGSNTYSIGASAHAEGDQTQASGSSSHAEGTLTFSVGDNSHSEGIRTHANGDNSHAEGDQTQANGISSHAEGISSNASGDYSHAEGTSRVHCHYAHGEGSSEITSSSSYAHAEGNSTTLDSSVGGHAEGIMTSLYNSNGAHTEGYRNRIAGSTFAHSEGSSNTSNTSDNSHAEGTSNTITNSKNTHVEGSNNNVDSNTRDDVSTNHIEGNNNIINSSNLSHVEGEDNNVNKSDHVHAEGQSLSVAEKSGNTHIEGLKNFAYIGVEKSHIEGTNNIGNASGIHLEGHYSYVNGRDSHIEGSYNTSYGYLSHVEGSSNASYLEYGHTEGFKNYARGNFSHIEGSGNVSYSSYSHVSGNFTYSYSTNTYGFLHGYHIEGKNENEVSFGRYNFSYKNVANNKDTIFSVGIGSGIVVNGRPVRDNALDIRTDGVGYFYSYLYAWDNVAADQQGSYEAICKPHLQPLATITYVARNAVGRRNFVTNQNETVPKYIGAEYFNNYGQTGLRMNMAYADFSHAEGKSTYTNGEASHAEGIGTVTYNSGEHASGKYNKSVRNQTLFSVGCGTSEEANNRRNAFHINDLTSSEHGIAFVNNNPIVTSIDKDGNDGVTGNTRSTYLWKGTMANYNAMGDSGRNNDTIYFVYDDGGASRDDLITLEKFNELKAALMNQVQSMIDNAAFLMNANQKKNGDGSLFFNGAYISSETKYIWSGTKTLYDAMPESMKSAQDTIFIITNN